MQPANGAIKSETASFCSNFPEVPDGGIPDCAHDVTGLSCGLASNDSQTGRSSYDACLQAQHTAGMDGASQVRLRTAQAMLCNCIN